MVWIVTLTTGFVIGFATGRWLTFALAAAFGVWIWRTTRVEVPHWFLGLMYGGIAAIGITTGMTLRRWLTRAREAPH